MNATDRGARWWRFDFHTHTPASPDYGKGPEQAALREHAPKEWLLDFMRNEIDCVAVTDHNTGAWIDRLKDANDSLTKQKPDGFRPLFLFPGVEITVNGGAHVLAIFDPLKGTSEIDALLGAVGFPMTKRGRTDSCAGASAEHTVRTIRDHGGLAIAAHVEREGGIFRDLHGATLKALLEAGNLSAIEVIDGSAGKPSTYAEGNWQLAEVVGSDAHHPTGSDSQHHPGDRFTWVKMGQPSLDGLRLALLDGKELSILRSDEAARDPNQEPPLNIESVEITDARYMGRGQPARAFFSPRLTAVIGGRGTGKSTLIEMMRLVMRRERDLPQELVPEFKRFARVPSSRAVEGALTGQTGAVITLRREGTRFRVRWSKEGTGPVIEIERADGSWSPDHGEVADRFPVRMLSQKQVLALSRDAEALLRLIDDAEAVGGARRAGRREEKEKEFRSKRSEARSLEARLAQRERLAGELSDVNRRIALFEEEGHAAVLRQYQVFVRQERHFEDRSRALQSGAAAIRDLAADVAPDDVPAADFNPEAGDDVQAGVALLEQASHRQERAVANLQSEAAALESFARTWENDVRDSRWRRSRDQAARRYDELVARLAAAGVSDPRAYGSLLQRQRALRDDLATLASLEERRETLLAEADAILGAIEADRIELTRTRSAFVVSVLGSSDHVRMRVLPFGSEAGAAERDFRAALSRDDGRLETAILSDGEGDLADLYRDLPTEEADREGALLERIRSLKKKYERLGTGMDAAPGRQHLVNHLRRLTPEQMDQFLLWWPSDGLDVQYRRSRKGPFMPLAQGSPGQKSAAILAFLLSYGNQPIVLDQPEDDLDNHLIYDLIVRQIRENKKRRQLIVATHNPNIVVNGDAELVNSMDHRNGQCVVGDKGTGCLQEPEVRAEVCRVMEGGQQAFEKRYQRLRAESGHA